MQEACARLAALMPAASIRGVLMSSDDPHVEFASVLQHAVQDNRAQLGLEEHAREEGQDKLMELSLHYGRCLPLLGHDQRGTPHFWDMVHHGTAAEARYALGTALHARIFLDCSRECLRARTGSYRAIKDCTEEFCWHRISAFACTCA